MKIGKLDWYFLGALFLVDFIAFLVAPWFGVTQEKILLEIAVFVSLSNLFSRFREDKSND